MIRTVGVVGAGTMGTGIAIVCARAQVRTVLFDQDPRAVHAARERAETFLSRSVSLGKLSREAFDQAMRCFEPCTNIETLRECDLIIEAVFESRDVKSRLLKQLHGLCRAETLLATNTSTLSVTDLAGASGRAAQVVGLHFCLPAERMKLVEVTPALNTAESTLQSALSFCEQLGQLPVVTQDRPGFILNALAIPLNNSAIRLLEAGVALPASIDTAVKQAFGHAMGPFELLDLVGLDTQVLLSEALYSRTADYRAFAPPLLRRMVAAGRLGNKAGGGFHAHFPQALPAAAHSDEIVIKELGFECLGVHTDAKGFIEGQPAIGFAPYDAGDGAKAKVVEIIVNATTPPAALSAALAKAQSLGLTAVICRDRPGRILDRLIRPYLNDALRAVDEALATPEDIDSTVRMGLGYREGPLALLQRTGLAHHYEVCRDLHERLAEPAFAPPRAAQIAFARKNNSTQ